MRRDIIVFDIETVADAAASRRTLGLPNLTDTEARDALSDYFLEKTDGRNDFPRQPFHQVVAIAYAHFCVESGENGVELIVKKIAAGGDEASDEHALLQGFFHLIEKRAPTLVTFNGRGFDVPVMKYRAMVHGISTPRWFSEGDKWNNYDSRYGKDYHLDLLEALSDYGASARCSMHEIATVFGVPGKLDVAGDNVRAMFENNELAAIRNYCETDVCTTALIYLRWQYFNGSLSEPAYARTMLGLRNYIQEESNTRSHMKAFLEAWDAFTETKEKS
ncbi:MAG: 3'-5' exonuclease [Mariprofundaceae bacterium]|nr:3'-5' exonuclease [Mariprofundaceae bacterium]